MDVWITQWHPDVQSTSSVLAKNPTDAWNAIQDMLNVYPDEHISIVPAD